MILLPSLPNSKLYVSQIIDNLPDLAQIFGADTETLVNYAQRSFKSSHRQHEWLTVRAMLRQALGNKATIIYDNTGKPHIKEQGIVYNNISISHTKTHVTFLLSTVADIGVDIEYISPRILSLSHRIVQPVELPNNFSSMTNDEQSQYLTIVWTVKEAIYKSLPHQQEVELLRDITIAPFRSIAFPITASARIKDTPLHRQVHCQRFLDNIVTCVI